MPWFLYSLFVLICAPCQLQLVSQPVRISSATTRPACLPFNSIDSTYIKVNNILDKVNINPLCSCGRGNGNWTRVAYLNMSDPNQQCPSNWTLTTSLVRGCGRSSTGQSTSISTFYSVHGQTYSSVCGRVLAYQKGVGLGFGAYVDQVANTLDSAYVSGVSVTHGPAGSRQHIWTFASALTEQLSNHGRLDDLRFNCPCTNISDPWQLYYQLPPFVGSDYFCDTGNRGPRYNDSALYADDPLWDGEGCGSTSSCCVFNSPPWFCKSLSQPISDDIEIRLCHYIRNNIEENVISLIEVYVK